MEQELIQVVQLRGLTMLDLSYMIPEESEDNMKVKYPKGIYKGPTNKNAFVRYQDKTYTIPEPFTKCFFGADPTRELTIHNRFSDETFQQSCKLPSFAVAIYDTIIGAEASEDYKLMQKGITWFQKNFPKQYYTLLD